MAGSLIERALGLLELLASDARGLPLQQLADRLDIPKSAAHRMLAEADPARLRAPGRRHQPLPPQHPPGRAGLPLPRFQRGGRPGPAGARRARPGDRRTGAPGGDRRRSPDLDRQVPGRHLRATLRPRHGARGAAVLHRIRARLAGQPERQGGAGAGGAPGRRGGAGLRSQRAALQERAAALPEARPASTAMPGRSNARRRAWRRWPHWCATPRTDGLSACSAWPGRAHASARRACTNWRPCSWPRRRTCPTPARRPSLFR